MFDAPDFPHDLKLTIAELHTRKKEVRMNKAQSNSVGKAASSLPRRTQDPLEALAEFATQFECRPGQTISPRENPLEHWYRTISGVARKCLVLPSGRRQIVDLLLPGDFFGVAAPEGHSFTLEAVVDGTRIASYPRSRVEKLA